MGLALADLMLIAIIVVGLGQPVCEIVEIFIYSDCLEELDIELRLLFKDGNVVLFSFRFYCLQKLSCRGPVGRINL